jgi:hypothetical protein
MRIEFLAAAQSEFEVAIDYYDEQRAGLGVEFADEIEQAMERIRHYPSAWSSLGSRVRRCHVNRFPYSVIYEARSEVLIIVAIQHHHKKPESWRARMS